MTNYPETEYNGAEADLIMDKLNSKDFKSSLLDLQIAILDNDAYAAVDALNALKSTSKVEVDDVYERLDWQHKNREM